jgi:hypothetical protein
MKIRGRCAQLRDAIRECHRQIDILKVRSDPGYGGGTLPQDNSREIALLEDELKRLREALSGLGESGR